MILKKFQVYGGQVIGNNPLIVCDTGHNQEGIIEVVAQIEQTPFKNLHFVFGLVSDKESEKILGLLPQNATYYFTKANLFISVISIILITFFCLITGPTISPKYCLPYLPVLLYLQGISLGKLILFVKNRTYS